MYFSGDSQVLVENGQYKSIDSLTVDSTVINMKGELVKVKSVHNEVKQQLVEVRHENWYTPTYCSDSCQVLTSVANEEVKLPEIKWMPVKDLVKGQDLTVDVNYYKELPETGEFLFNESTVKYTREIGYLFGMYAGYGSTNGNTVEFKFGPNNELVDSLKLLVKNLFNLEMSIDKGEFIYTCSVQSTEFSQLFNEFGPKLSRQLPLRHWINESEYLIGLFQGLVEYDVDSKISRYIPLSKGMGQVFAWVCNRLGLVFENDTPSLDDLKIKVYPVFVRRDHDDTTVGKIQNVSTKTYELDGWNLTTNDESNTFIVNGVVVKGHN
jgi:hypothetical protein